MVLRGSPGTMSSQTFRKLASFQKSVSKACCAMAAAPVFWASEHYFLWADNITSRILLHQPFAHRIFGLGPALLQRAFVERHAMQGNADDTARLLNDRVFRMREDRRATAPDILLEGHADTADVHQQSAAMLPQHLQMRVPTRHHGRMPAIENPIHPLRR